MVRPSCTNRLGLSRDFARLEEDVLPLSLSGLVTSRTCGVSPVRVARSGYFAPNWLLFEGHGREKFAFGSLATSWLIWTVK